MKKGKSVKTQTEMETPFIPPLDMQKVPPAYESSEEGEEEVEEQHYLHQPLSKKLK